MSQGCGSLTFVDGGVLRGQTIINAQVTDSVISNSSIQAATLESLTNVASPAAKTILDAIAALPADQLAPLVAAMLAAMAVAAKPGPVSGVQDNLPTEVLGDRAALLGKPALFASFGDYVVPLYNSGE